MPIAKKLLDQLEQTGNYEIVKHRKVFTAYDAAQTMKRKLDQIVKSLLVKAGGTYYLVHVPADKNLNLEKLAKVLQVKKVTIPSEKQITTDLKIKPGSVTAFGFLHKVETAVDQSLLKVKKAVFSSGSFTESIEMPVKEFLKLTNQYVAGVFTVAKKIKKPKVNKPKKKTSKKTVKKSARKPISKKRR